MDISACRFCLAKEDLASLFGKLSPAHFTRNQVFLATGVIILPSDSLPQEGCKACIERIKNAINLRKFSMETQIKLQQKYSETISSYYDKETSNLLYEIDNFKTDDEELNILLKKINRKVIKTVNSLTDNNTHIDNNFNTDYHFNTELDNESENSQADNLHYQTDLDHNYHIKSNKLPVDNEQELGKIKQKREKGKIITRKVLHFDGKDNKLIKKHSLLSKLNKSGFKTNPAMLPVRQFKKIFQSSINIKNKKLKTKNSSKIIKNRQTDLDIKRDNKNKTKFKNKSQFVKKISNNDNNSSQFDNSIIYPDNEDDEDMETEDWDVNQIKEIEVQKHIDKKRQERYMSLAVTRHPTNGRLQCKVCLHSVRRGGFVSHAKRHFPPEFACEICGKMFYENSFLQYHHQRMHGQEKPLACTLCEYRAVFKYDMTKHMRIHTGERPYTCDVCSATFRVRGDIVQHMRTHFGVKRVQCPRCPHKWFRCLSDVAKHNRRIHHNFTYFCHLCSKTYHGYSGRSSIRKHLSRVHGIPLHEQPTKLKYTKVPKPDEYRHEISTEK